MLQLELILKGISKQQRPKSSKRLPINASVLKSLHVVLDGKLFGSYKDILMKAACSLAFFGLLRCGEFTTYCNAFDPDCNKCLGEITFEFSKDQPVAMQLFLRASKTDPLRQGCTIRYFSVDAMSGPVKSLYKFLQLRLQLNREPRSPLFRLPDSAPFTRGFFLDMLSTACQQAGFCPEGFSGHSFQVGAATVCARKNIAEHFIQTMGRWSSSSYKEYIRVDKALIMEAHQHMADTG